VGNHIAPHASDVPHYMRELLDWLNSDAGQWPAVISSAVLHFRFEFIHPFGDGNGRTGRILAAWELYRRKFDSQHIFAMDETLWDHRPKYYAALDQAQKGVEQDLSRWIEFMTEMLEITLGKTWERIEELKSGKTAEKINLTVRQEKLLKLLRAGPIRPAELQKELEITKGGLHYLLKPLLCAGLVQREGGYKTGVYRIPDSKEKDSSGGKP
jgi:Fic family protein